MTGADLAALCREAAMVAISQHASAASATQSESEALTALAEQDGLLLRVRDYINVL